MLIIISPAKTLDFTNKCNVIKSSTPIFTERAKKLVNILHKFSVQDLQKLMKINKDLALLTHNRFQNWTPTPNLNESKQAVCAFKGEAYRGLNVDDWTNKDFDFAQKHLRILSGLYGILCPLDLISAYRLEMGSKLETEKGKNLYDFWGDHINKHIIEYVNNQKINNILNLASDEYFKSIKPKLLNTNIISPVFKDFSKGTYRTIVVYTKKARGLMSRFVVKNKITNIEDIKSFDYQGYYYNERLSNHDNWIFTRD